MRFPLISVLVGCLLMGSPTHASSNRTFCRQARSNLNDPDLELALASIFTDELGYTLIGEKPVSIQETTNIYLREHPEVVERLFPFLTKVFEKSPGFILKIFGELNASYDIEFFNVRALKKVIFKHPELQAFIERKFIDMNGFLSHLKQTNESIFETFNHEAFLLGLILGYGRDNAEYYCRVNEVGAHFSKHPCFSILSNGLKPNVHMRYSLSFFSLDSSEECWETPATTRKFDSFDAELEWLQKVQWDLTEISRAKPPCYIHLPFYICRHSDNSERTRNKYIKARDRLANLFYSRSFSEAIIETSFKAE